MRSWLIKSEPSDYSLAQLRADKVAVWDGVRNYQARNFLREMQMGDRLFYYHSNTKPPGIVGLAKVTKTNIDDPTQFEEGHQYYDPKSTPAKPRWQTVEIAYGETLAEMITLTQLKEAFSADEFAVVRRGNRLSVMPIADEIAQRLLAMGSAKSPAAST